MKIRLLPAFAALFAGFAASLTAQVTFTFSGHATGTALGYTTNDAVTFTLTSTAGFADNASSFFGFGGGVNFADWREDHVADGQLWASLTGTGLTGTYAPAAGDDRYAQILLQDNFPTSLSVFASSDGGTWDLGTLRAPNNNLVRTFGTLSISTAIIGVDMTPLPGSHVTPDSFFGGFTGTYSGLTFELSMADDFQYANFSIDTVTISVGAVPEPSAYALIAGIAGLGLAAYRRRQPA